MIDIRKLGLTDQEVSRALWDSGQAVARAQLAKALDGLVAWLQDRGRMWDDLGDEARAGAIYSRSVALHQAAHAADLEWPMKEAK